ncbi:MAG TPA: translation factor GTPase family protein [Streptosporangiaceae bacterium]
MRTLNLGILAHVDAGKTSLTERLLYNAGAITAIGSVDEGSTQTDSLALERARGITIKAAVASFPVGRTTVNLIDTPGHPDFIAEVERALSVLDGAVLVVSAAEGVQPQTRILMRALGRLGLPALIFVNKIDRGGAEPQRVLRDIAVKLTPAVVPMGAVHGPGTRNAGFRRYGAGDAEFAVALANLLADHDDRFLAAYLADEATASYPRLRAGLAELTRAGRVHPVFFGSAITGVGTGALAAGLTRLLPAAGGDADGPVSARVFKVERGPAGEKIAWVRMFSGTVSVRDRVRFGPPGRVPSGRGKVTAVALAGQAGRSTPSAAVTAGQIGRLWGLAGIQIGDQVAAGQDPGGWDAISRDAAGAAGQGAVGRGAAAGLQFAPPALETAVVPGQPGGKAALRLALAQLAEQDPLISLRQDGPGQDLMVSLYGEVQKEVIQATLAADFGLDVTFRESTVICIERPAGTGEAAEFIDTPPNPFLATVGLRVRPGAAGSGVTFRLGIELGALPLAFLNAIEETVRLTLRQGLRGWQVADAEVTLTRSGYWPRQSHAHGTFDASMSSTAGDFRQLTPLVLMAALAQAGTRVHEPVHRFRLEVPADVCGPVLPVLGRLRATWRPPVMKGPACLLEGEIPAGEVSGLERQLPGLSRGEGVLESEFSHYQPVTGGPVPVRPRTDHNPLHREDYLRNLRRVAPGRAGSG